MNKKIGRPPLPKGHLKDVQLGVRFNSDDDRKIEKAIGGTTQTKADWVRDAALVKMQEWVTCKWTAKDLDGKSVEFSIVAQKKGPIDGIGTFFVLQRGDGKMKIKIESRYKFGRKDDLSFIRMRQESADWIVKLPVGSNHDFSCFDPALKNKLI